jgi:asparagine synthase (glutamine-hydrolysing)
MIEGISALEPGSFLVWQAGSVRKQSYWSFPQEESGCKAPAQYRTEIRACLKEAVCMQTVSDVPVGVFLSGGIDSSSLVALLREGSRVIDTFSIVFREPEYDEGKFSRRVAERFGSRHHEILLGQHDILKTIPEFLNAMDQPTIDGLNTYLISREARAAGIKVVLNGIGGDELFAGYSTFHTVPKMEKFLSFWTNIPMPLKKSLASLYEAISVSRDSNRKLAELARENGRLLHPYFLSRSLFTLSQRDRLLRDSEDTARASTPLLQLLRDGSKLDPINRVSLFESRLYMLNTLLRDADVMSMAHGLELRVPLLDAQLAEKVFTLPGSCKIGKGRPKPLLVDALDRGLPRQVVHRRKQGFTLPFEQWLRDELRLEVQDGLDRLANGPLAHQFNPGAVRHIWNEFWRHRTSWSRPWSLYVLQRWCEQHSVSA